MDRIDERPRLLITGSSGLIGQSLIDRFAEKYDICALDIERSENLPDSVKYYEADLTNQESLSHAMDRVHQDVGGRLASVIHLAAYYDFSGEPSPKYQQLTVDGTERLLKALKKFEVDQFIYFSSLLVMKPVNEGDSKIEEDSAIEAKWLYPQSKVEAEKVVKGTAPEIPKVVLRIAGVYDEWCHSIPVAQQISRIYENQMESHLYPGDKTHGQPFIHLKDVVSCVASAIEKRGELDSYEVFLVAEPEVLSYERLQSIIGNEIHGKPWSTIRIPKMVAKAGAKAKTAFAGDDEKYFIKPWMIDLADDHYPVEISRVCGKLEWSPNHRLEPSLKEMIGNLKRKPIPWYEENNLQWPGEEQVSGAR